MSESLDALIRERVEMFDNLTATQHRCTALLQEVRALKWLNTSGAIESRILADVVHERRMQDQKWGPLDGKAIDKIDGTGPDVVAFITDNYLGHTYTDMLASHRRHTDDEHGQSFVSILLEEFLEATVEQDPKRLRAELVQVAAVAVKWIQAIDMRQARTERRVTEPGIPGPGWWCQACGGFNGEAKQEHRTCRCCGARKVE